MMTDDLANNVYGFRHKRVNTLPIYIAKGVDYQSWRLTQNYDFTPMGASESHSFGVLYHRTEEAVVASALIEVPAGPTVTLDNVQGHWKLRFGLITLTPRQALKYAIEGKLGLRLLSPDRNRTDMIANLFRGDADANIDEAIADARLTS